MKKNIIFAAFAAASALLLVSSCAKEQLRENINTGTGKVFSAAISQDLTKTTITSEYKVNWDQGDQINIGEAIYSATPDASDATKATFTKVSGPDPTPEYTAVYPASIMVGTLATLPATQTYEAGKFNAPMCAMSETESLEFKNFCGVLCFALKGTDKVKSIAVTANEQLCGPFEFADATSIIFGEENKGYTVTLDCGEGVQLSATDSTNFYISLPPATYTAGMKIVITNTEGKTIEKLTTKSATIARNQIYTFNWTATFAPAPVAPEGFVDLGVKDADGKPLYWAEKNLGASNPEDYGDYFAWGETAPYYTTTGGWPATPAWKEGKTSGYKWDSYCGKSSFVEWSTPPYDATSKILLPAYDAATKTNSSWRTPTSDEFKALAAGCVWIWCDGENEKYNNTTVKGYIVYKAKNDADKGKANMNGTWKKWDVSQSKYVTDGASEATGYTTSDTHIFFPAAGYGLGTSLTSVGSSGCYWSSFLYSDDTGNAFRLHFSGFTVNPQYNFTRSGGCSVRPVTSGAAPAPTPLPSGALPGVFTVSDNDGETTKQIYFSQGNLYYDGSKFNFETNQYSFNSDWDEAHVSHFYWSQSVNSAIAGEVYDFDGSDSDVFFTNETETTAKASFTVNVGGKDQTGWRTLSTKEWQYLFNTRTMKNGKDRYTLNITYGGKMGLVLYPDDYDNDPISGSVETIPEGVVFLPAAGSRDGSVVGVVGDSGFYWSSTVIDDIYAYYVYFYSSDVFPDDDYRSYGCSVRLVTEVK